MPDHLPDSMRRRLSLLAVEVLEEAFREADRRPVERTALHRLALAWLANEGIAFRPQVARFWKILAHEGQFVWMPDRQAYAGVYLSGWRERASRYLASPASTSST